MSFEAIIFDLDYTLFDESSYLNKVIEKSGVFNKKEIKKININYDFRINSRDILKDILLLHGQYNQKNKNKIYKTFTTLQMNLKLYKGFIALFNHMKKIKIKTGILTNGLVNVQKNKIKLLNLKKYIDLIIFTKESGYEKPHSNSFTKILFDLKIKPENSLFVGDHQYNDIRGAAKIGMKTFWIDHLNQKNCKSDYRVNNPNKASEKILSVL